MRKKITKQNSKSKRNGKKLEIKEVVKEFMKASTWDIRLNVKIL
jgi:hypothetical protein